MPMSSISFPELYLMLPIIGAFLCFLVPQKTIKSIAISISIISVFIGALSFFYTKLGIYNIINHANYIWLDSIGSMLELKLDGTAALMCFLTSFSVLASFVISKSDIKNPSFYFALIFILQIGLNGVFLSYDAFSFYLFWEIVLIPTYFLCSYYGGSNALHASLKFFIYTFIGSLFMLFGIIYLYLHNPAQSFAWESLKNVDLNPAEQTILFFAFMIAFVIKLPLFPFHTWQAKLYTNSPIAITLILSSVMVKMGLIGVIRWVLPFFPIAVSSYGINIIILAIIGIIYASFIAIRQNNLKLIIAYSSIAHIGLMAASLLTQKTVATNGAMLQMFNHGINILGLWFVVHLIQEKYQTNDIKELGGIMTKDSFLGTLFLIIAFANIALPLTNSFAGEVPMLFGLFQYNNTLGVIAGTGVIFSAVYMLRAVDFSLYGQYDGLVINALYKQNLLHTIIFIVILFFIFFVGVYSKFFFDIIQSTSALI